MTEGLLNEGPFCFGDREVEESGQESVVKRDGRALGVVNPLYCDESFQQAKG